MCGIAGIVQSKKINSKNNEIKKLMKSRGPDQQGHYDYTLNKENKFVNLYSSRLKIIDLEDRSNQPYYYKDYVLVFNGEIYNYLEIKKILIDKGYKFQTSSDTEVLIKAYDLWGEKFIKKLNGMWALCILNKKTNKLILTRDFFGEKPLFYYIKNQKFLFGSEIKYIFHLNSQKYEINEKKINDYIINGYKSIFKDNSSFFEDINFVNPGEIIRFNIKNFSLKKKNNNPFKKVRISKCYNLNIEKAKSLFFNDFKKKLRSDVPISFCLSGGVDSAGLVSLAKKKFNLNPYCFSIINKDKRYNEYKNINFLKKKLNLNVDYITIPKLNFDKFIKKLRLLIKYRSAPISTISYYIHSFISEKCAKKGFKVICSGTAADEIFTGYYDHTLFFLNELKMFQRRKEEINYWKKFTMPKIRNKKLNINNFKNKLYRDHIYNDVKKQTRIFKISNFSKFSEKKYEHNNLKNRMKNELLHESVPVILFEDDSNSMMHSIENRSPYLNIDLINYVYSMNTSDYIRNGYTKNILRDILKDFLPDEIRLDRKKIGFNASINELVKFDKKKIINYVKKSIFFKDKINFKQLSFLKKKNFTNSESKLLFNILNICIFYEEFDKHQTDKKIF